MPTWRVVLEYEGTRFHGWQEQPRARTVAGELRRAAEACLGGPAEVMGSGRTDAGVHALGQVARLQARRAARPGELLVALNKSLPPDINVLRVEEAPLKFDPRRDAVRRSYIYQIATRRTAFAKRFVWWVRDRLDVERMRGAAGALEGRHDFAAFCERRGDERSTVVVVERFELALEGDLILMRISASHFLWKMVRRLTGALVEVGRGALEIESFAALLKPSSRGVRPAFDVAAHTAPPSGLFLEHVAYREADMPGPLVAPFPVRSDQ